MYSFTKGKIYYIIWADHWSKAQSSWDDHEYHTDPMLIKSIGWCIAEGDEAVRLVAHREADPDGSPNRTGDLTILKVAIKKAWELTNVE